MTSLDHIHVVSTPLPLPGRFGVILSTQCRRGSARGRGGGPLCVTHCRVVSGAINRHTQSGARSVCGNRLGPSGDLCVGSSGSGR